MMGHINNHYNHFRAICNDTVSKQTYELIHKWVIFVMQYIAEDINKIHKSDQALLFIYFESLIKGNW